MVRNTFQSRLSRRSFLAGTAGAASLAALPTISARDVVAAALQQAGGKVTIGQVGDIQNLDPFALLFLNYPFIENVYDQLLRLDHEIKPSPALLESYTISPDGLKFTLKVKQGIKYHSGNTMTAADVAANLERARNPDTAGNLFQNMAAVSKVTAVDDTTVEIDFTEPAAYFESALGLQPVVEPAGFDNLKGQEAGTGAFTVKEWIPNDHLTLVKNADYWNTGRPLVDEAEVKIFADEGAMVAALEGGVIDVALSFPPREYERLKDTFTFTQGQQGANFYYLGLNAKQPPFDNKLVRQAMAHALDRETMVANVLFGIGAPIMTPFPDFSPAYSPEHNQMYPYDLDKAKALLEEAGVSNLSFSIPAPSGFPEFGKFAEILQADAAKIGVEIKIEPMDSAQWYPILVDGTYEATFSFAGGTQLYPTRISLSSNFPGTGNVAWPDGKAPQAWAEGLAEADATFDPAKQKEALKKAADSFMDEAWNLPISFRTTLFATAKTITGLDGGVYDQLRLDQVTKS
ncbi:MAG: peptide/nickel transport system substrate-binding protein [Thermomicrobiales bacterium]|nr:peptide/nickel transport system substrate-binding protein [Thermomicrobiales bacterium]